MNLFQQYNPKRQQYYHVALDIKHYQPKEFKEKFYKWKSDVEGKIGSPPIIDEWGLYPFTPFMFKESDLFIFNKDFENKTHLPNGVTKIYDRCELFSYSDFYYPECWEDNWLETIEECEDIIGQLDENSLIISIRYTSMEETISKFLEDDYQEILNMLIKDDRHQFLQNSIDGQLIMCFDIRSTTDYWGEHDAWLKLVGWFQGVEFNPLEQIWSI